MLLETETVESLKKGRLILVSLIVALSMFELLCVVVWMCLGVAICKFSIAEAFYVNISIKFLPLFL